MAFSSAGAGAGGSVKLERAYLQLFKPSTDGTLSQSGAPMGEIAFQFNPKELALAKTASWARGGGKGNKTSGPPQYKESQPSKLNLEMFFDASDSHDGSVVRKVEQLFSCCVPTEESRQKDKPSPPWVLFRWGGLTGFMAYVSSVSVKYTLFTPAGSPIRALCTVTLEELAGEAPRQNPTSGGLVPRRVHTLVQGDTLQLLAYQEYGNAALWRDVAAANGIDDPMRLPIGRSLLLPAPEELTTNRTPRRLRAADGAPGSIPLTGLPDARRAADEVVLHARP